MHIDKDSTDKYKHEYGVLVRRLGDVFTETSPLKEASGGAISLVAPGETITEHVNKENVEEVFVVLDGAFDFTLDGERATITTGDVGFARIGQAHAFTNVGAEPARLLSLWWRAVAPDRSARETAPSTTLA
jgi:mannose-6-phosphate isomerase-like protein (cupin superfamily)